MTNYKRIVILFLMVFATFTLLSCDFFKSNTTTTEATSTTIITTTTSDQSTSITITTTDWTTSESTLTTTTIPTTTYDTTAGGTITTTTTTTQTTTTTTTTATTTYSNEARIEITVPSNLVYEINEQVDFTGMVVTFFDAQDNSQILNETDYQVSGVDTETYGQKTITVTYGNYEAYFTIQVNLPSYYWNAMNKSGNTLFLALRTIVNSGFSGVSYGDARYILDETDMDPNNTANLIQVYSGASVTGVWYCPTTNDCNWNREHVWPQNRLPVSASNSVINMASDLQNLKPASASLNSSRGDKYYDWTTTTVSYEPRDEVKGDLARILLYMIVMYDELSLVDGSPNPDNLEMGLFSVLLEWNAFDPVDDFERNRNEVIYSYQHNRNPFIDYPEFADLIWGE